MGRVRRPWSFGVLHADDSAFSRNVLAGLRAKWGEAVGDNQPYALNAIDFSIPFHAQRRGIDYLELEVRQDLLRKRRAQADIALALADIFERALASCAGDGPDVPRLGRRSARADRP